jgi:hypothetical protein
LAAYNGREFPLQTGGNVYFNGARPYAKEAQPVELAQTDPQQQLVADGPNTLFKFNLPATALKTRTTLVTARLLGMARTPDLPYENVDGSPITIDKDYFGKPRSATNPSSGPFENPGTGLLRLKVWESKGR